MSIGFVEVSREISGYRLGRVAFEVKDLEALKEKVDALLQNRVEQGLFLAFALGDTVYSKLSAAESGRVIEETIAWESTCMKGMFSSVKGTEAEDDLRQAITNRFEQLGKQIPSNSVMILQQRNSIFE